LIRKLNKNDKELYMKMAESFYLSGAAIDIVPTENIEKTFEEMVSSDRYLECFFIEEENDTAGFILIAKTFSQESGGIVIWIEEAFIKDEYRSKGYGKKLFDFIESEYFSASRLRLETEPDNHRAIKLYKSLGFEPFEYIQFKKRK